MSFAIFDENFYLSNYPDVKAAVDAGGFSSGLEHFQQTGLAEGRVLVSPYYDEQFYLRANPDVAAAVAAGAIKSGLQHYIQSGEAEGRSVGTFNQSAYLELNPDVAAAVAAGTYSSGLQHYLQYGQFEANRQSLFSGITGNDIVTGFGAGIKFILGISPSAEANEATAVGIGEVDTLIGREGMDAFALGYPGLPELDSTPLLFYVGGGNTDYALIQNFEQFNDIIFLGGSSQNYNFQAIDGNLNISTASGDLIGIVEGVTALSPISSNVAALSSGSTGEFFILV